MWTRADAILEQSQNPNTKFFALQVMDGVIKYRWNALPDDQREGIKNFISNLIIKLSTDASSFRRDRAFINKINNVLVQILKHDWPKRWSSFVPDLVGAAKQSESLCENCMNILRLLSEEVFDFSRGELTQAKITELKNALNTDFPIIHELCEFVLQHSQKPELIQQTLLTLHAFLSGSRSGTSSRARCWTPAQAIAHPKFRNVACSAWARSAARGGAKVRPALRQALRHGDRQLQQILPGGEDRRGVRQRQRRRAGVHPEPRHLPHAVFKHHIGCWSRRRSTRRTC